MLTKKIQASLMSRSGLLIWLDGVVVDISLRLFITSVAMKFAAYKTRVQAGTEILMVQDLSTS